MISIGDILKLADLRGPDLMDEIRSDDNADTIRNEGAVVSIEVNYSNALGNPVLARGPLLLASQKMDRNGPKINRNGPKTTENRPKITVSVVF